MSEHPEPILFSHADEFRNRPAYVGKLNCASDELSHLVGKYDFPKERYIECGLNGCTTLHGLGFVYAKSTGEESHCGTDCGRMMFGLKWQEVTARFRAAEKASNTRKFLLDIQTDANEIIGYADQYTKDVTVACDLMNRLIESLLVPAPELHRHFVACIKNGGKIQVANYSSKKLRRDLGHKGLGADLETIGTLQGAAAVSLRNGVIEAMTRAVKPTRVLMTLEVAQLSREELAYHSRKFQAAREALQATGLFLREARRFMRRENLEQLKKFRRLFPSNQGGQVAKMLDAIDRYCDEAPLDPLNPRQSRP
ncbi:hypothetical protein ACOTJF_18405 [Achromobacter ruhlandii]|uniref:hypothetical protein n=1 Tax=Achromobacter ruhlandii TaxID=72557 RepID=UPI003BA3076C